MDDAVGSVGIQSSGGFIQEEQRRRRNQLHPDAAALPFTSRNTTQELCSYLNKQEKHAAAEFTTGINIVNHHKEPLS